MSLLRPLVVSVLAFNKRYRPNEYKGILVWTLGLSGLGALLIAVGIVALFGKKVAIGAFLLLIGFSCLAAGFWFSYKKDRLRLFLVEFFGRSDVVRKGIAE